MRLIDICSPHVAVTYPEQPLAQAAVTLRDRPVGALVVVDSLDPLRRPVGILTDRDVVRGQLAKGADLYCLVVRDVMTEKPLTLRSTQDTGDAIEAMNARAVRRAPIVDAEGSLVGIVTLDDLLPAVANELLSLGKLMGLPPKLRPGART
jgi:CBS domain-containing protein